ncbi:uncharacterized protein LOC110856382 isoform X2 [Folsomia candida]|uniref:uncharacterized protein LOC110856382 isoform X2 n=1 Tax=Folsomia candida TaxID=158441 RepID=UPI000B8F77F3|nr:uncharacterized protein LOC110856382 isoform X2 [Folsomia candida]
MAKLLHIVVLGLISVSFQALLASSFPTESSPVIVDRNGEIHPNIARYSHETPEHDLASLLDNNHGDYEVEEEEEVDCPSRQFWHIRGQRCVPLVCIGGNRFRDPASGECLIRKSFAQFGDSSGGERSLSRYNARTQSIGKGNKGRLRFGLPTKVKG